MGVGDGGGVVPVGSVVGDVCATDVSTSGIWVGVKSLHLHAESRLNNPTNIKIRAVEDETKRFIVILL